MTPHACCAATHARIKADPCLFLRCTFRGYITLDGVPLVMVRDCHRCSGAIGLRLETVMEMYPLPGVAVGELIEEMLA